MPKYVSVSVTTVLPGQNQWAEIIDKVEYVLLHSLGTKAIMFIYKQIPI